MNAATVRPFLYVVAVAFGIVTLAHLVRLATGTEIVIDGWSVPQSLSVVGALVTGTLSGCAFALTRHARDVR
jgi:hypothetical protein